MAPTRNFGLPFGSFRLTNGQLGFPYEIVLWMHIVNTFIIQGSGFLLLGAVSLISGSRRFKRTPVPSFWRAENSKYSSWSPWPFIMKALNFFSTSRATISDTVSHSRIPESPTTLLWNFQISYVKRFCIRTPNMTTLRYFGCSVWWMWHSRFLASGNIRPKIRLWS